MTTKNDEENQVQTELASDAGAQPTQNVESKTNETAQQSVKKAKVKTIRVEFLTNCTHNRDRYHAGQKTDLPEDVFDALSKAKAVRRLGE